jgi:hypothetical protein
MSSARAIVSDARGSELDNRKAANCINLSNLIGAHYQDIFGFYSL